METQINYFSQIISKAEEICIQEGWLNSDGQPDFDLALKVLGGESPLIMANSFFHIASEGDNLKKAGSERDEKREYSDTT